MSFGVTSNLVIHLATFTVYWGKNPSLFSGCRAIAVVSSNEDFLLNEHFFINITVLLLNL